MKKAVSTCFAPGRVKKEINQFYFYDILKESSVKIIRNTLKRHFTLVPGRLEEIIDLKHFVRMGLSPVQIHDILFKDQV